MNNRGIVFTWVVAFLTIGFTAFVWFIVSFPLEMIENTISSSYTYPLESQPMINLVKAVLGDGL